MLDRRAARVEPLDGPRSIERLEDPVEARTERRVGVRGVLEDEMQAVRKVTRRLRALAGSVLVRVLFGAHPTLGSTIPEGSVWQSFFLEIVITFLLMFTILNVATGAKEKGATAGLAVGAFVGLAALFAGPISGASMNPARSLAPALVSGQLQHVWVYLLAPALGSGLAVVACRCSRGPNCCSERMEASPEKA